MSEKRRPISIHVTEEEEERINLYCDRAGEKRSPLLRRIVLQAIDEAHRRAKE